MLLKNNDKKVQINTKILSYAVKYASTFMDLLEKPLVRKNFLKGDKKTYQMDYKNLDQIFREVGLDIKEGADFVMVKPGMPYLDVISTIKQNFKIPVVSYQVSGEYSMIANGIKNKIFNDETIIESLTS